MSKPTIPFTFDPAARNYEQAHLVYKDLTDGRMVSWPIAGISMHVPTYEWYPDHEKIEQSNGGLVSFHRLAGFSVGTYHEFFLTELYQHMGFRMGKTEVTFGQASPMMAFLFDSYHEEHFYGTWEDITTARIVGVELPEAEVVFLNAAIRYKEASGVLPVIVEMSNHLFEEDDEEGKHVASITEQRPPIRDIEPVRFFYYGLEQSDATAACIYFYRVLEYYSFYTHKRQLHALRIDTSVSEDEFAKQVLNLMSRDEKGPLLQLINRIADPGTLKQAALAKLIKGTEPSLLGEAIYAFRNSIVHGKTSYGYALQSTSVLQNDPSLVAWRAILKDLANRAIAAYGSALL